jgi:hypothetical protein
MKWPRPQFGAPSVRRTELAFVALLSDARIDDALEAARVADEGAFARLHVELRLRANDGGWLDEALGGRVAQYLAARSSSERYDVERCRAYAVVEARLPDEPHADVLRAALATLQALAADDDLVLAVDRATARIHAPDELIALDPRRPFDPAEHLVIVREAEERRPGTGRWVRSRGLSKLARPDVGARAADRPDDALAELVRGVAEELAAGRVLSPGERVEGRTVIARSDDGLADAPPDEAPLYELRAAPRLALVR